MSSPTVARDAVVVIRGVVASLDVDVADTRRLSCATFPTAVHLLFDECVGGIDHLARGREQLVGRSPEVPEHVRGTVASR